MERYFILDKFNTWYDWRLVLTGKDVTPPEPKTNYVEIDGMDGTLDLSESLTGEITYKDRTVSASFWTSEGSFKGRASLLRKIVSTLHGKKIKIIEPDDPDHYFYGRVAVKSLNNILPYATFTIEATCEPWRYAVEETVRTVPLTTEFTDIVINNNGVKTLCPTIELTGDTVIFVNGVYTPFVAGTYKISDIKLRQGVNIIRASGLGSMIIKYREADL